MVRKIPKVSEHTNKDTQEAMKHLINRRKRGTKIYDLAGTWEVTDEELKEINTGISPASKKWKPQKS